MRSIISKYLRHIVAGIEVIEERHGFKDNPILKEVKPRNPDDRLELQDMKSEKKTKQVLPDDRKVEREKVVTKTPDMKPSRKDNTTGEWEYSEKMRQYQEDNRANGNGTYLKKKINPETDKRFKNKGE